jgi:hypothetical protein
MTIRTDSTQGLPQPGLDAAREGRAVMRWVNAQAGVNAAATVITAAESYENMMPGYRYIIRMLYYNLSTASDTVRYELGVTSLPNGAGVFTPHTPYFNAATAATIEGTPPLPRVIDPPICLRSTDGACIAMRLLGNDAGATINAGFAGWYEEDI